MRHASLVLLLVGCDVEPVEPETSAAAETLVTTEVHPRRVVTTIRVNGRSADTFLVDPATGTNGGLNAARDEITNTSALDFSYITPDADPDFVIQILGSGAIPNSSFQVDRRAAHLHVTTFPATRCRISLIDGTMVCADTTSTFDLTWVKNGVGSTRERVTRVQELGPLTTKVKGEFISIMANVNGTWDGHTTIDDPGNLVDTRNTTIIREITRMR